jgi:hypothetical protein
MTTRMFLVLLLLAEAALGQSNVFPLRVVSHLPGYERIFLPRGHMLRAPVARGIDDLKPGEHYTGTNWLDQMFMDLSRERTNGFYTSCVAEVPLENLSLRWPGNLLNAQQVRELLQDTVAIPRQIWTNEFHKYYSPERYVFSLMGLEGQECVVDQRAGPLALVYFPDGTYRCLIGRGYGGLPTLQQDGAAHGSQPIRSETNSTSSAAGSRR